MELWNKYAKNRSIELLLRQATLYETFIFTIGDTSNYVTGADDDKTATEFRFLLHLVAECIGRIARSTSEEDHGAGIDMTMYTCMRCKRKMRLLPWTMDGQHDGTRVDYYYCPTEVAEDSEDSSRCQTFGDCPYEYILDELKVRRWKLLPKMIVFPQHKKGEKAPSHRGRKMRNATRLRKQKEVQSFDEPENYCREEVLRVLVGFYDHL